MWAVRGTFQTSGLADRRVSVSRFGTSTRRPERCASKQNTTLSICLGRIAAASAQLETEASVREQLPRHPALA